MRKNLSSELGSRAGHRDINIWRIGYVASEIDALGPGREVVDEEPEERQVADRGDALRQEERPLFRGEGQGCDSESRSSSIANRK